MKACKKCGAIKQFSEFHKGNGYVGGVKPTCKACVSEYHKELHKKTYKKKPKEFFEEKQKALLERRLLREAIKAKEKKEKLERIAAELPIKIAEKKRKKREYNRKYRAENPGCRRIEKKNRKLKVRTSGKLSAGIVKTLLEKQKCKCVVCKGSIKDGFHIDHIIPIAKGGMNVDNNVQLLCPQCNMSKSDKHPVDFMQSKGFLL